MSSRLASLVRALLLVALALGVATTGAAPRTRIAIVKSSSIPPFEQATAAIVETLRRSALQPEVVTFDLDGDQEKSAEILPQLHRGTPTAIVTVGSLATTVVLGDPWDVPVLFSMVLYPAQSGFVTRPGRGVTGASLDLPLDRQFETIRRLLPAAKRVGVLYHPTETGTIVDTARPVAAQHGFTLTAKQVSDPGMAVAALTELMETVDAVWTVADSHVFTPQTTSALVLAALRKGVPLVGLSPAQVRIGALAALSCDYGDVGAQTAELALKVLGGEHAAALTPAAPRKLSLVLNLRTAEHLGITIAPEIEREAGEVIR
jgi:putative ABC transport system substrate-binding protein